MSTAGKSKKAKMEKVSLQNTPKTLKGWLRHLYCLNNQMIDELKGSENLTKEQYGQVVSLTAGISNDLAEINDWLQFRKDPM